VTDAAIRDGLSSVRWPGRMTLLRLASGQQVLLDGAHNAASADALHTAFEQQFSKVRPTLLLGVLADKDPQAIATTLAPLAGRILLVPVDSRRTLPPEKLLPACRAANPSAPVEVCNSLAAAMEKARPDPFVVITGSLYLVGEAMELMKLAPDLLGGERGLNEWEGKPGRLRRE
jgi:dihydrofolate synthase/folylpolyglutamate synthase